MDILPTDVLLHIGGYWPRGLGRFVHGNRVLWERMKKHQKQILMTWIQQTKILGPNWRVFFLNPMLNSRKPNTPSGYTRHAMLARMALTGISIIYPGERQTCIEVFTFFFTLPARPCVNCRLPMPNESTAGVMIGDAPCHNECFARIAAGIHTSRWGTVKTLDLFECMRRLPRIMTTMVDGKRLMSITLFD